jgi:hypothetical protein
LGEEEEKKWLGLRKDQLGEKEVNWQRRLLASKK